MNVREDREKFELGRCLHVHANFTYGREGPSLLIGVILFASFSF